MDFSGIEKLSFVDYDSKIATVLFTKGCNFKCPFCHNGFLVVDPNFDEVIPWKDIIDFLNERKGKIEAVVFSGGEPTLMPDLEFKIKEIKSMGFLIKLDTNGSNFSVLKRLIDQNLLDYVAMDIKNSFPKYAETAGILNVDIDSIQKSIAFLINGKVDYEFRTTLIKEFHRIEDFYSIANLIKGTKKYALQKFKLADGCINKNLHPVEDEDLKRIVLLLKENGIDPIIRGY